MPASYSPAQIAAAFEIARRAASIEAAQDAARHHGITRHLAATVYWFVEHGEPSDWQAVLDGDVGVITMERRLRARSSAMYRD